MTRTQVRIKGISLKNFMSFGESSTIEFGDKLNVIVGPNDSGKTSIFRAIGFVSDIFGNKSGGSDFQSFAAPYYHNGVSSSPIEISVDVEFDDDEKRALTDFLLCSSLLIASQHDEHIRKVEKELVLRHGKQAFRGLFNDTTITVRVQRRQMYPVTSYLRIKGAGGKELYIHSLGTISTSASKPTSYNQKSLVDMLLAGAGLDISTFKQRPAEEISRAIETYSPANIFDTMFDILSGVEDNRAIRVVDIQGINFSDIENKIEHFFKIDSLDEGHDLVNFMKERGFMAEGANLFELIQTIYDYSIVRTSNSRCAPGQAILGKKAERTNDSHEFTTDDLPEVLFNLKNSINPEERDAYKRISEEFLRITSSNFEVLLQEKVTETETQEFTLFNPSAYANTMPTFSDVRGIGVKPKRTSNVYHEIIICFVKNGLVIPVHMAAAGMLETLYLLTVVIAPIKKTILLDEPALNLHPNMQRKMLDTLISYSIRKNGNQVVLITHSPSMLEVDNIDTIHRLSPGKNGSTQIKNVREVMNTLGGSDKKQLTQWLRSVEIRSLLFSRGIILVEGPSDKVVIETVDRYLSEKGKGANIQDREIAVISVGGKKSMRIFLALAKELKMNYLMVVDSDALMSCEGYITLEGKQVRTSPIVQALHESGALSAEDAQVVESMEKDGIALNSDSGIYEYKLDEHILQALRLIAERYNVLVLSRDLEAALQIKESRRRKPVMSADAIFERIENNSIPEELETLINSTKVKTDDW